MNIEVKDEKFFIPHERLQLFPTIITKMETYKEGGDFVLEELEPNEFRHFYSFVIDGKIRDWNLYQKDYIKIKPIADFFGIHIPNPDSKKMFSKMMESFLPEFELTEENIITLLGIMDEEIVFRNFVVTKNILEKFSENEYFMMGLSKYFGYQEFFCNLWVGKIFDKIKHIKFQFENFKEFLLNSNKIIKCISEGIIKNKVNINKCYYLFEYFCEEEEIKFIDYTKPLFSMLKELCPSKRTAKKIKNHLYYNPMYKEDGFSLWTYLVIAQQGYFDEKYYQDSNPEKSLNNIFYYASKNDFLVDINPFYNDTYAKWFMKGGIFPCFRNEIINFLWKLPVIYNIESTLDKYRLANINFMRRLNEERFVVLEYCLRFYKVHGYRSTKRSQIDKLIYLMTREELEGIWRDFIENRLEKGDYFVITFFKKKYIKSYLPTIKAKINESFLKKELRERTKSYISFIDK